MPRVTVVAPRRFFNCALLSATPSSVATWPNGAYVVPPQCCFGTYITTKQPGITWW